MKKNLFTLLFMAVALFSAATLVSCGDDDEPVSVKNKFTVTFEINTSDPEVRESAAYKAVVADMHAHMQKLTQQQFYLTDEQANDQWNQLEYDVKNDVQNYLDIKAKALNDRTLSCTLTMLKNGVEFRHKDWKTWYLG